MNLQENIARIKVIMEAGQVKPVHEVSDELYDALKYHYSDVCCNDDVLINKLIDALYDRASREELFKIDEEEIIHNITHTIEIWLRQDKMTPDPFWADDIDEKNIKKIIVWISKIF